MGVAPVWVRGLKPYYMASDWWICEVAPVWVRGLKQLVTVDVELATGRTRMGAWIETHTTWHLTGGFGRTRMGAWIETYDVIWHEWEEKSHPYGCVD